MDSYIVDGLRTAIGNFAGSLSSVRPDDLGALVLKELLSRNNNFDHSEIADIAMGCANQAGEDNRNVARMSALLAGIPYTVPAETVNRLCASGMSAVINVSRALNSNEGDVMIAGGVENMTRGPWVISKVSKPFGRDAEMHDSSFGWRFINPRMKEIYGVDAMGETAENLAELYKINREDQDRFALWSQQKASASQAFFDGEIVPVALPQKKGDPVLFKADEFIKPESNMDGLSALRPSFRKNGTVTAGNASGLNDGAAAILMASESGLKRHSLEPMARVVASAVVGVEPRIMGIGPVGASRLALKRAGISLDQVDILELNEAFAAQVLACTRSLGLEDNDPRINPHGGAISLGHPLGMSGSRILLSAARQLNASGKKYALCTMCIGVGQGYAVVLENSKV
jgi:acetyl-CoA acyltransferase